MKGAQGLVIAAALGIVGAMCNWFYVSRKAADLEKEAFVYVKASARLRPGDVFKREHFEKVEIPKRYVGELKNIAVPWSSVGTAVGYKAIRTYPVDQLLLRSDLRTPPQKSLSEQLGPDEVSQSVLVNPSTFIPENFKPGESVYFGPPATARGTVQRQALDSVELAGPFRILRIGSRAGSSDVYEASGMRSSRSNVLVVPLVRKNGKYDDKSRQLLKLMRSAGGQGLEVQVLSAQKANEGAGG